MNRENLFGKGIVDADRWVSNLLGIKNMEQREQARDIRMMDLSEKVEKRFYAEARINRENLISTRIVDIFNNLNGGGDTDLGIFFTRGAKITSPRIFDFFSGYSPARMKNECGGWRGNNKNNYSDCYRTNNCEAVAFFLLKEGGPTNHDPRSSYLAMQASFSKRDGFLLGVTRIFPPDWPASLRQPLEYAEWKRWIKLDKYKNDPQKLQEVVNKTFDTFKLN